MKKLGVVLVMGHLPGLLLLQKGRKRVHKIPLEEYQQVSPSVPQLGMMGYLEGQRQLCLLRYNSKTPTTIPVVENILISKRLKRDYNQLSKNF
jgi:hypothetical protein